MRHSYRGTCTCGAVQIEVTGQPDVMGYCHCRLCRTWSGAPMHAFTLWQPDAVTVIRGEEHIWTYRRTLHEPRTFCELCGGHLMTRHAPMQMVGVQAAVIPELAFSPQMHINYAEAVLPLRDGLPKLRDIPMEFGGSGEVVPE